MGRQLSKTRVPTAEWSRILNGWMNEHIQSLPKQTFIIKFYILYFFFFSLQLKSRVSRDFWRHRPPPFLCLVHLNSLGKPRSFMQFFHHIDFSSSFSLFREFFFFTVFYCFSPPNTRIFESFSLVSLNLFKWKPKVINSRVKNKDFYIASQFRN